jgi:tRNA A-37 threonylcarbamoyl transferase component Bud32
MLENRRISTMPTDMDVLINEYINKKGQLEEYDSYINHVKAYKGYVFKEINETNKFNNEVNWLKKLMNENLYTPKIVGTYNQNTIITEKIEGNTINDELAHEHLYNIGELLAELHNIKIENSNVDWKKTLLHEYKELKVTAEKVLEKNIFQSTTEYLEKEIQNIKIEQITIIHRDLRPENVIYNNEKYYLLDFEVMCIGDRDYDFIRMLNLFNEKDMYNYDDFKNFMDGYRKINNIKFDVTKWWLYSRYYAFRMMTRILSGNINRSETFEHYLLSILEQKEDKITNWINKYNR